MIHDDAIDLIQYYEGCQNEAYACSSHVSKGGKWPYLTIGYGHSGPDVHAGMRITTAQAREYLARDLANVEAYVDKLVKVPLSDFQRGAVCSLAMNLKPGTLERSQTLARLNAGDFGNFELDDAYREDLGGLTGMSRHWAQFRNVAQADGTLRPLMGLVTRRASELELFHTGRWSVPSMDRMPQYVATSEPVSEPEVWRPGKRSAEVVDLHAALEAAGYPTTCGDAYTWVTVEAVKAFQRDHGLKADGIYGRETANKLQAVLEGRA